MESPEKDAELSKDELSKDELSKDELSSYSYDYTRKNTFMEERFTPEISSFLNSSSLSSSKKKSFSSRDSLPQETSVFLPPPPPPPEESKDSTELSSISNPSEFSKDAPPSKVARTGWKSYLGILCTLISGLMFASMGLIVKVLKDTHAMNIGFFRFSGMLLPALPFLLYAILVQKKPVFTPVWPLTHKPNLKTASVLFGRAVIGCIAVISHFTAIQYMNVGDAMIIGSCSPVFVTLVAHLFLGEKCGLVPVLCALFTIIGVGVTSRPPLLTGQDTFDTNMLIGAGFALIRMVFTSFAIVFVRYLRQVHVALILFSVGLLQLLQNTSVALLLGVFSLNFTRSDFLLALLVATFSFIGQLALTCALKFEQAGPFAVVRTCDVIFAFILQFVFLGVAPDAFSIVGGFIVIFAVCVTVFRKWVGSLPKDDPRRKTYRLILK